MRYAVYYFIIAGICLQCKSHAPGNGITLENTYWKLVEVGGIPLTTPVNGREIYMLMTTEKDPGALEGFAGCNGLGGRYKVEGSAVNFEPITTRMYCEAQMEFENLFIRMLTAADSYRLNNTTLELYSAGDLLGKFESVSDI